MMPQNAHGTIFVKSIIDPLDTQFIPHLKHLLEEKTESPKLSNETLP